MRDPGIRDRRKWRPKEEMGGNWEQEGERESEGERERERESEGERKSVEKCCFCLPNIQKRTREMQEVCMPLKKPGLRNLSRLSKC